MSELELRGAMLLLDDACAFIEAKYRSHKQPPLKDACKILRDASYRVGLQLKKERMEAQ